MDEETFLKLRQQREEARSQRVLSSGTEDAQHRKDLVAELERLSAETKGHIENNDVGNAVTKWKELQQKIQSSADTNTLPAHDMKQWNTTLSDYHTRIEGIRNTSKAPKEKKFSFSSKKATAPSSKVAIDAQPEPLAESSSPQTADDDDAPPPTGGVVFSKRSNETLFIGTAKAVFVRNCSNCVIFALPTQGSFFLSDCVECTVFACCHQMRIKSCREVKVHVWCSSIPVIESCSSMRFGPYDWWTGLLRSTTANGLQFASHEEWATVVGEQKDLVHAKASHKSVDDFHWLKQSQSPNWSVMTDSELNDTVFGGS